MRSSLMIVGIALMLCVTGCDDRDQSVNDGQSGKHITLNRFSYKITVAPDDHIFSEDVTMHGSYSVNNVSVGTFSTDKTFTKTLYFNEPTAVKVSTRGAGIIHCSIVVEDSKDNTRKTTHNAHGTRVTCVIK